MAKMNEWQLKLRALVDLCKRDYGWDQQEVANRLGMTNCTISQNMHNERATNKRIYYAIYGLIAEQQVSLQKEKELEK